MATSMASHASVHMDILACIVRMLWSPIHVKTSPVMGIKYVQDLEWEWLVLRISLCPTNI